MSQTSITTCARVTQPRVGEWHRVPCMKLKRHWKGSRVGAWVPLIGPLHEDLDVIGFEPDHWHIDWRFASSQMVRHIISPADLSWGVRKHRPLSFFHGVVITTQFLDTASLADVRLMMKRAMPTHPAAQSQWREKVIWLKALEEVMSKQRMKCRTCPHRGMPLGSVRDRNGHFVCTGHGLTWHKETGKLIKRA